MKVSFPTIDLEVSLAAIEYDYLKYICYQTLQTSDEVLRSQLRQLRLPNVPDFDTWRTQQAQTPQLLPEVATTVDVESISTQEEDVQSEPVEPAVAPPEASEPSEPSEPSPEPSARQARKPRTPRTAVRKQFDPKQLLPDFRGHSLQDAVQIVLAQEPDQTFGTDDLLMQVYGEFTEAELSKGRRSLGKVLSIGAKQGLWQRTQEKPPLYRATADTAQPTPEDED